MRKQNIFKFHRLALFAPSAMLAMCSTIVHAEIVFDQTWNFFCAIPGQCVMNVTVPEPHPGHELRWLLERSGDGNYKALAKMFRSHSLHSSGDTQWCSTLIGGPVGIFFDGNVYGQQHVRLAVSEYPRAGSAAPQCLSE